MVPEVAEPQVRWTTIKVPVSLDRRVAELASRVGKAKWKVLLDAIALYETSVRRARTKEELPKVDKVLWYIEKLCMSVGALKERPSPENLGRTLKTASQIRERLGVDVSLLERAVNDYVRVFNTEYRNPVEKHDAVDEVTMEVNMALKSVLIEITYKHILKEELESPPAPQPTEQAGEQVG